MKTLMRLAILLPALQAARAVNPADRVVPLSVTLATNPPAITLHWPVQGQPTNWLVQRKAWLAPGWSTLASLTNLAADSFTDTAIQPGAAYEYKVTRQDALTNAWGFLYAALDRPPVTERGALVLVVESNQAAALDLELTRLTHDLMGDGWRVIRLDAPRVDWHEPGWKEAVTNLKARIRDTWLADTAGVRAVYLLGHVPVPYSGHAAPDGHTNDHRGAWPADAFYGDMDGPWPDLNTTTNNCGPRLYNTPGDGKFDYTWFDEYDAELMVGRVDFADLPAFAQPETELLRQYLAKSRRHRHNRVPVPARGLVRNNFPTAPDAFAQVGIRDFGVFFGPSNVALTGWFPELRTNRWLAAYGCGAGANTFDSAAGVATTSDFATGAVHAVFTMLLGSYFGDWDTTNNLLRAAIASMPAALTCMWAGRPKWFTHPLDLGEPVGAAFLMLHGPGYTNYEEHIFSAGPHAALLGDPTLRLRYPDPPRAPDAVVGESDVVLSWTPPENQATAGYLVARADEGGGSFSNLHDGFHGPIVFTDTVPRATGVLYSIRAARRDTVRSGVFTNLSQGVLLRVSADGAVNRPPAVSNLQVAAVAGTPVPVTGQGEDPDSDPLAFALLDWPAAGLVTGVPPNWVYLPPAGFTGTVHFAYDATDGWADSEAGSIEITIAPAVTAMGTPVSWLIAQIGYTNDYDQAELEDPDGDGMATWAEYRAGTDPLDPLSVFAFRGIQAWPASNRLTWYATTNSGVWTPFTMRRTPTLGTVWENVASNLPRAADGTNIWWDTNPPPRAFYRVRIP